MTGDLTNLFSFKNYSGISGSSSDTVLQQMITQVSREIERFCSRKFYTGSYVEFQNTTTNQKRISVRNKPLIQVNSVRFGYVQCIQMQYNGSAKTAMAQITGPDPVTSISYCILRAIDTSGVTENKISLATNYTASQLVAAIAAIPGWALSKVIGAYDVPTAWMYPMTINLATGGNNYVQYFAYPYVDILPFEVDYLAGTIGFQPLSTQAWFFNNRGGEFQQGFPQMYQSLMIDYKAGYDTIPPDIELLANKYVNIEYNLARTKGIFQSETLAEYSYTLMNPKLLRDQMQVDLAAYRSPVFCGGGR